VFVPNEFVFLSKGIGCLTVARCKGRLQVLLANVRLDRKTCHGKNALAYFTKQKHVLFYNLNIL